MNGAARKRMPPPFPAVAVQLIQQMQDPDVGAGEVGRLIALDPALTASLLRLVNSPFFGLRRQIAGVPEAVMVLGMSAVRRMVLSIAVATPLRQPTLDPEFARQCWQHTVGCAALARRLIDDDPAASELAFTAGLLHDIGQVQLLQQHGAAYVALHAEAPHADRREAERARFGQSHDLLGAELLEAWGLPAPIADAARVHHAPLPIAALTRVQQAVWVANRLAGAPQDASQAQAWCPAGLVPVAQALQDARAEFDMLAGLLNG